MPVVNSRRAGSKDVSAPPAFRKALLAEPAGDRIRCGLCYQRCLIPDGEFGLCATRVNLSGELYTTVYGDILACESRPVEIKPFFHFHPGKTMMTFCGPSCNLRCQWCQNHSLSRAMPKPPGVRRVDPSEIIDAARAAGDIGLCASFTEPTLLFEFCLELFRESREIGMVNTFVSNGYMRPEALNMLARSGLNAINIDIKGSDGVYREQCRAGLGDRPVWENVRFALALGLHVEVVHLVVSGLNDSEGAFHEICSKHLEFAGPEVPLHITSYRPAYRYRQPPTSIDFLERAYHAAREAGILFPYLGNVPGHAFENTYCPDCGKLLLARSGFRLEQDLTEGYRCGSCGFRLPVVS